LHVEGTSRERLEGARSWQHSARLRTQGAGLRTGGPAEGAFVGSAIDFAASDGSTFAFTGVCMPAIIIGHCCCCALLRPTSTTASHRSLNCHRTQEPGTPHVLTKHTHWQPPGRRSAAWAHGAYAAHAAGSVSGRTHRTQLGAAGLHEAALLGPLATALITAATCKTTHATQSVWSKHRHFVS
jgi:hypothetical protein